MLRQIAGYIRRSPALASEVILFADLLLRLLDWVELRKAAAE
jgi:hypothetical protein